MGAPECAVVIMLSVLLVTLSLGRAFNFALHPAPWEATMLVSFVLLVMRWLEQHREVISAEVKITGGACSAVIVV